MNTTTEQLISLRDKASKAYYETDSPIMSDDEFDALTKELSSRGVDETVGHGYTVDSNKVSRTVKMASLRKAHDGDGVLGSLVEYANEHGLTLAAQPKCDGLPISIKYRHGILQEASTRGDGFVGENVTTQARLIDHGMLNDILDSSFNYEVRGEVLFPTFRYETMKARGYTKPRSSAVGALRKGNIDDLLLLVIVIWDILDDEGNTVLDPINGTINGAPLPPVLAPRLIRSKDVSGYPGPVPEQDIKDVSGDFADDGIVYKIVSQTGRNELGEGSAYPNWAVAYKFEDVPEITTVTGVTWQANRVKITPVAELEPVEIDGSIVTRASLHNVSMLEDMDLHIGDVVSVRLANKIIPQVVGIIQHNEDGERWSYPDMEYERRGRELVPVSVDDATRINGAIRRLGIKNVGPRFVDDFVEWKGGADFVDLWLASEDDVIALGGGYGPARARKIIESMHAYDDSYSAGDIFSSFLIEGVGSTRARQIIDDADGFGTVENLIAQTSDDWEGTLNRLTELVGPSVAGSVMDNIETIQSIHDRYQQAGLVGLDVHDVEDEVAESDIDERVSGLRVLVSGTLPTMKRTEAQAWIEAHGGIIASGVSKNTDMCVFGAKASGGKVAKAESLGINIVSGEEFESWVAGE